jgi:hypothetical protein
MNPAAALWRPVHGAGHSRSMDERLPIPRPRHPVVPSADSGGHAQLVPPLGSTLLLDPKALKRLDDVRAPQVRPRTPYELLFDVED